MHFHFVIVCIAIVLSYGLNWPDLSAVNDDDELGQYLAHYVQCMYSINATGFDPWSISSKGFEDLLTSQPATTVHSGPPPPPVINTVKTESECT